MASKSTAQEMLEFIERIAELGPEMNASNAIVRQTAVRRMWQVLGRMEAVCERRVTRSEAEAHRRVMESCHISLPEQTNHAA